MPEVNTAGIGRTCAVADRSNGSLLQSCFSGFEEFLPGRSHWPDLLQQGWCLPGNMKYCSQETQPPHRNVTVTRSDSTELATDLSTDLEALSLRRNGRACHRRANENAETFVDPRILVRQTQKSNAV
jgi:hypothetical protein